MSQKETENEKAARVWKWIGLLILLSILGPMVCFAGTCGGATLLTGAAVKGVNDTMEKSKKLHEAGKDMAEEASD